MQPIISFIIPCYNSSSTVDETLDSVYNQSFEDWEAIIVNDGSTDDIENKALEWIKKDARFKYYSKENGGLASARNFGIDKAIGEFILPLDSDNKIRPYFVTNALKIFDTDENIGVLYGDAICFGEQNYLWKVGKFDIYKMLEHNYIDACALIRKTVFETVGNYDPNLPFQGHEDWDLWLKIYNSNFAFYYLEEITFDYRITSNSMIKSFKIDMLKKNIDYINKKHYKLYSEAFLELQSIQKSTDNNSLNKYTTKELFTVILKRIIKKFFK